MKFWDIFKNFFIRVFCLKKYVLNFMKIVINLYFKN